MMSTVTQDLGRDAKANEPESPSQRIADYGDLTQFQLPGQRVQDRLSKQDNRNSPGKSPKGVSPTVVSAQENVSEKGLDGIHLRAAAKNGHFDRLSLQNLRVATEVNPLSTGTTHIDRHFVKETVLSMQPQKPTTDTEKEDKTKKSPRMLAQRKSSKNSIRAHFT